MAQEKRQTTTSYLAEGGRPDDPVSFSHEVTRWGIDAAYPTQENRDSSGKYIGDRY